ncbi:hypothetical protein [Paenibacillus sp. BC26]|uniref:hypothetical protein n=1 Tax=Paenibacillus sp. BC26 TaxID=1881032 RepID=UPI0008E4426C|nr:hypothetical protein [Paenibacillus sp. BC26]SFS76701.1 hypothetical protein SAMN05428962_2736 [Paenibacillus sp. BC26]
MEYKGQDWTELANELGISTSERSEGDILKDLDKRLSESIGLNEVLESTVIYEARSFLNSFTKNETYKKPLFQGLLAINDDHTFIKYFRILLPHMWA